MAAGKTLMVVPTSAEALSLLSAAAANARSRLVAGETLIVTVVAADRLCQPLCGSSCYRAVRSSPPLASTVSAICCRRHRAHFSTKILLSSAPLLRAQLPANGGSTGADSVDAWAWERKIMMAALTSAHTSADAFLASDNCE